MHGFGRTVALELGGKVLDRCSKDVAIEK